MSKLIALSTPRLAGLALASAWLLGCSSDTPAPPGGGGGVSGGGAGGNLNLPGAGAFNGGAGAGAALGGGGSGAGGGEASGASGGGAGGVSGGGAGGVSGAGGAAGGATCKAGPFALTSAAFDEGGPIDEKFRCTGENVTPPLEWTCGPEGTKSYALTQIHVGSQSLHWALFDVAATISALPEGIAREAMPAVPAGSKQVEPKVDGSTWYGYSGPCPGGANQSYTFFVYALDVATLPGITTESTIVEADAAIKAHDLAVATLTGTASKP